MAKQPSELTKKQPSMEPTALPKPVPKPVAKRRSTDFGIHAGGTSSESLLRHRDRFHRQESNITDEDGDVFIKQDDAPHLGITAHQSFQALHSHASSSMSSIILPAALIVGGYIFLKTNEGWNFATTAYVMVQIVTTIGYGDVVVEHESSMLFMTFFSLAMLIIVAYNLDRFIQKFYAMETQVLTGFLNEIEHSLENNEDPADNHPAFNKLVSAICISASLAIFGTVFYTTYEACSCSYDVSKIEGCVETSYQECVATGGVTKSLISTMYMVVMTFTTIGFGDFSLESKLGRELGTVWMLLCVASTAHLVSAINGYVTERRTLRELMDKDMVTENKEVFDQIDKDGSGTLSRSEFIHYTLIKYGLLEQNFQLPGLVSEEVIDAIEKEYTRLDTAGNEEVTYEMITRAVEEKKKRREDKASRLKRRKSSYM